MTPNTAQSPPERADGALSPRKERLLKVAADLFAARGYHAVSTDALGQAAGISGPGVYRHFGSKADILLALCETVMDSLLANARTVVAHEGDRGTTLERLVRAHADFAIRERSALAVYFREQRELPTREHRALRKRQRDYETLWCEAVAAHCDLPAGEVRATVKLTLSMLNGTVHIKDTIARTRLEELLLRMAAGALQGAGITVPGGTR